MKRERIFYLDFVRALAVFLIFLTHFNARYLYFYMTPEMPQNAILTLNPFNIYIGNLGVALFFIISGAALFHVYKERCEVKTFYRKRFLSLYPMFWIAYIIAFLFMFFVSRQMLRPETPKVNFLLTIFGMDGYLTGVVPNFYILGEWFLGFIVILYLVFPLIRKEYLSHPVGLCIAVLILYLPLACHEWLPQFPSSKILFVRLPEFLFGMIFLDKIKRVKPWMLASAVIILILNTVLKPNLPESLQTTYVGISFFLVLAFVSKYLDRQPIRVICGSVSKYSYAVFLTHHFIIDQICSRFPMESLTRSARYTLFLLCLAVTALASWLLYHLHASVMNYLKRMFAKPTE